MNDSSSEKQDTDTSESSGRSWIQRLSRFFTNAPADKQDLLTALNDAQESALLDEDAINMIEGVLEVAEMRVQDVMIPRAQMQVIDLEDDLDTIMSISEESGHSRFPVVDDDKDDIVGILLVKDLLPYIRDRERDLKLRDILRKPRFIPESKRLNMLLSDFRKTRQHMAIVIDEFGGVAGLITIEDVIEEIIGDIDDEHDEIEAPQIRRLTDNEIQYPYRAEHADDDSRNDDDVETAPNTQSQAQSREYYWIDALYTIEELNEQFSVNISDDKADTIGGLVALTLGKVPNQGEKVELGSCTFTVLTTAKRRIESLEMCLSNT